MSDVKKDLDEEPPVLVVGDESQLWRDSERIKLLNLLYQIIGHLAYKLKEGRYDKRTAQATSHRLRTANTIAKLIDSYARLSKDIDLDQLNRELEGLKKDLKIKK
jgi:hypothetical protein